MSFNCVLGVNIVESWLRVCCECCVIGVPNVGVVGEQQSDGMSADTAHLECVCGC